MAVYAIGDLHLSHHQPKPMGVFGPEWDDHPAKIRRNWNRVVGDDDLVIVAGDISWAMQLAEAAPDLVWLAVLNGENLLVRGNHDYGWSAIGKVGGFATRMHACRTIISWKAGRSAAPRLALPGKPV